MSENLTGGWGWVQASMRRGGVCRVAAMVCMAGAMLLGGCASYSLQGVVIEGDSPGIYMVRQDDARLAGGGVDGARVQMVVDPTDISPKQLPTQMTDMQGRFTVPMDSLGAGFLEYELGVFVEARGYRTLYESLPAPPRDRRLLIVLSPGRSGPDPRPEDPWKTFERHRPAD